MNRGPRGSWIGNPEVPGSARGEGILRGRWYPDVRHMHPCAFSCRMQDERARDTVVLVYACLKTLSNFAFPPGGFGAFPAPHSRRCCSVRERIPANTFHEDSRVMGRAQERVLGRFGFAVTTSSLRWCSVVSPCGLDMTPAAKTQSSSSSTPSEICTFNDRFATYLPY